MTTHRIQYTGNNNGDNLGFQKIPRDNNGVNQYDGGKFMFITTDEESD